MKKLCRAIRLYLRLVKATKTPAVILLDWRYTCADYDSLAAQVQAFRASCQQAYMPDLFDCDDFAWLLKAWANKRQMNHIGFVIGWCGGLHCWNLALGDQLYYIEPQNGQVFRPNRKYQALVVIL